MPDRSGPLLTTVSTGARTTNSSGDQTAGTPLKAVEVPNGTVSETNMGELWEALRATPHALITGDSFADGEVVNERVNDEGVYFVADGSSLVLRRFVEAGPGDADDGYAYGGFDTVARPLQHSPTALLVPLPVPRSPTRPATRLRSRQPRNHTPCPRSGGKARRPGPPRQAAALPVGQVDPGCLRPLEAVLAGPGPERQQGDPPCRDPPVALPTLRPGADRGGALGPPRRPVHPRLRRRRGAWAGASRPPETRTRIMNTPGWACAHTPWVLSA